ncbi:MAG: hypothetical protein ACK4K3_02460 [Aquabacterium sp.]
MPRCSWTAWTALSRTLGLMAAVPWWLPLTLTSVPATAQDVLIAPTAPSSTTSSTTSTEGPLSVTDTRTEVPTDFRPTRQISLQSLRGRASFGKPPEVSIDGQALRLAPGARIRDEQNLLVLSGQLAGRRLAVNYTLDTYGLVKDVWLLRPDELQRPWPRTREESTTWRFDPLQQTWIKP